MCDEAVDTCLFVFDFVPDWYKTQEICDCDKVALKASFMLKYYRDRYKNKQMCGKAVHTFLPTLKFVSNWFDTNKMLKILAGIVLSNNDIVFVNEDSSNVRFLSEWILMLYAT